MSRSSGAERSAGGASSFRVIGVGHRLRQDDAVGPYVAEALAARGLDAVAHEGEALPGPRAQVGGQVLETHPVRRAHDDLAGGGRRVVPADGKVGPRDLLQEQPQLLDGEARRLVGFERRDDHVIRPTVLGQKQGGLGGGGARGGEQGERGGDVHEGGRGDWSSGWRHVGDPEVV